MPDSGAGAEPEPELLPAQKPFTKAELDKYLVLLCRLVGVRFWLKEWAR